MIKTINKNKETVILHCLLMYQNQSLKFKFTYVELCRPPTNQPIDHQPTYYRPNAPTVDQPVIH